MTFNTVPERAEVNSSTDLPVSGEGLSEHGRSSSKRPTGGLLTLFRPGSKASVTPWTIREDGNGHRVLDVGYPTIYVQAQ